MENQENDNGKNTKIYERALEISRSRLNDLAWNNILYEANLDVVQSDAEDNKNNDEIVNLQHHIQELQSQNVELVEIKNEFEEKYTQVSVDYSRLQKLDDLNAVLRGKLEALQEKIGELGEEDLMDIKLKIGQMAVIENEKKKLTESLKESNDKLSQSDATSKLLINERKDFENEKQELEQELELLRPKVKQLESIATKGQSSSDAYSDLEQEFLRREQRHNEMQQKHNKTAEELVQAQKEKQDVDSALVTQKKLYTELLQRMESKEEEHMLELEKLKPTPKKRGRPKKADVKDGGLLESALV